MANHKQSQLIVEIEPLDAVTYRRKSSQFRNLLRFSSVHEGKRRSKYRSLFDKYDYNQNGYLEVQEMKALIQNHKCRALPAGLARHILIMADENQDGRIDFPEFYKVAVEHDWLFEDFMNSYCRTLVPPSQRQSLYRDTEGQYEKSLSWWPPPLTMLIISIIQIMSYVYDVIVADGDIKNYDPCEHRKGPAAQLLIYEPLKIEQAWRFITYMFVHAGIFHLGANLILQIFLGTALELFHCWWRVALVYLAGVAAGSVYVSVVNPGTALCGASAGVYALITAHIATVIINWQEMEFAIVQLFVCLLFCAIDLGTSIYVHIHDLNKDINYNAHLAGAFAGLLIGIGVLRNLKVRSWEKKLWWFAVLIYSILMISAIMARFIMADYFLKLQQ